MQSAHVDTFNHDEVASTYDQNVLNEGHPIRAGYNGLLNWVIETACITKNSRVLDLGSGTGNLCCRIETCAELVCVDVSDRMTEIAKTKLKHLENVTYIKSDLLEYFDEERPVFDAIISTYAIHHLTEEEKESLCHEIWKHLKPGGRAVFGDLMLETLEEKEKKLQHYRQKGDEDTAESIEEEFFWIVNTSKQILQEIGFEVLTRRFSDLSFGVAATRPTITQV